MRRTILSTISIQPASLLSLRKPLSGQALPANTKPRLTTLVASHATRSVLRFLVAVTIVSVLVISNSVQRTDAGGSQTKARQSKEDIAIVLQREEQNGSPVEATIELSTPLNAESLETITASGQIQSIRIISTTTEWVGAIYSTADSPITSLVAGLRTYEHIYRESGPGDPNASFAMTAFTVRGSTTEVSNTRDLLPNSNFAAVRSLSPTDQAKPQTSKTDQTDSANTGTGDAPAAALPDAPFAPTDAEFDIHTLANSERSVEVSFSWDSQESLAGLQYDRSALEIQILFLNQADDPDNNLSYIGENIRLIGANFGHAYLDDPFMNPKTEKEIAVGSYKATADFQAGKTYELWAIADKGKLEGNLVKLSFQRGIYQPFTWEDAVIEGYCTLFGFGTDPAKCVAGKDTTMVTRENYTGKTFSIVAPTVPTFKRPTQTCSIPFGYPHNIPNSLSMAESEAVNLGLRIRRIADAVNLNGGVSNVGCPTNFVHTDTLWWPRNGWTQDVDGNQSGKGPGAIMLAPDAGQAFWVHGAIWARYSSDAFGGPKSVVGEPTGNEKSVTSSRGSNGAYQAFTRGYLYFNARLNKTLFVVNAIADKYRAVNLHQDSLGFPTSDEYPWEGGARSDFEGGFIHWTPAAGAVIVRFPYYDGHVDVLNCDVIAGWAADRSRLNTSIDVKLYDAGVLIATVPANQSRPDVGAYLKDNGLHGFNIPIPASVKNSQAHSLSIRFEASATNLVGSPKSITCNSVNPSPTPTPSPTNPAPNVNSVNPNPVPTFNANQNVQVGGSNFQGGLIVDVFNSSGTKVGTLSGSQIQNLTANSFTMVIFLGSNAGTFGIEVVNPDGKRSLRFTFSTTAANPAVHSLSPSSPPAVNNNQQVLVNGSSFQSGLKVDVLNSAGTKIGTLSGSQILNISPNSFTMVVNLGSTPGNFGIEVINPSGTRSSRFNFSTQAVNPLVNSISPNPIPTFNANQDVQASGNNFLSGLTVDVFNSSGTKVGNLSGSQIKNVSGTSFTMVIFLGSSADTFGMEVVNPNGNRSSRFSFSTVTSNPSIKSINPNPVPVFNGNQNVQVSGSNFQFGLILDVFNSSGVKVGTLSGSQVLNVTPSSFTMVINLGSTPGSFGIEVVNPSGRRSGRFNFSTR